MGAGDHLHEPVKTNERAELESLTGLQCEWTDLHHRAALLQGKNNQKSWFLGPSSVTSRGTLLNNEHSLSSCLNLSVNVGRSAAAFPGIVLAGEPEEVCEGSPESWEKRPDSSRAAKGKRWWFLSFPWEPSCLIWRALPAAYSEAAVYWLLIGGQMSQRKPFKRQFGEILKNLRFKMAQKSEKSLFEKQI